jgi:hypothetical protein
MTEEDVMVWQALSASIKKLRHAMTTALVVPGPPASSP